MNKKQVFLFFISLLIIAGAYFIFRPNRQRPPESKQEMHTQETSVPEKTLGVIFEEQDDLEKSGGSIEKASSGKTSFKLTNEIEYSYTLTLPLNKIPNEQDIVKAKISVQAFTFKTLHQPKLVFSIDNAEGKNVLWEGKEMDIKVGGWQSVTNELAINKELLKPENKIKVYVWNQNKDVFYVDDFKITMEGYINFSAEINNTKPVNFFYDFEHQGDDYNESETTTEQAHSGFKSFHLSNGKEFSPVLSKRVADLTNDSIKSVSAGVWIFPEKDNPNIVLVITLNDKDGKEKSWRGKTTQGQGYKKGEWQKLNYWIRWDRDNEKVQNDDIIKVYAWDKGHDNIFIDDFEIVFGEPGRKFGSEPFIYIDPFKSFNFEQKRNQPPFLTSFLTRQEAGFMAAENLIQAQNFITGNFISDVNKLQELIAIADSSVETFAYCQEKKTFNLIFKNNNPFINSAGIILAGNFNNDRTDEVLFIENNKKKISLFSFEENKINSCVDQPDLMKFKTIWESDDGTIGNWICSANDIALCNDFNGNKQDDILLIDRNSGNWQVLEFRTNHWEKIALGNDPDMKSENLNHTYFAGRFFDKNKALLCYVNSQNKFRCVELSNGRFNPVTLKDESFNKYINQQTEFLPVKFGNSNNDQIMIYDRSWRFDLKLAATDPQGFYIKSWVDFSTGKEESNPKYYGCVKLIPWYFNEDEVTGVLAVMRNSADGKLCKQVININDLPNGVQLYHVVK